MRKEVRKRHIFTKQYWWRERERWGKEDEEERERGKNYRNREMEGNREKNK